MAATEVREGSQAVASTIKQAGAEIPKDVQKLAGGNSKYQANNAHRDLMRYLGKACELPPLYKAKAQ